VLLLINVVTVLKLRGQCLPSQSSSFQLPPFLRGLLRTRSHSRRRYNILLPEPVWSRRTGIEPTVSSWRLCDCRLPSWAPATVRAAAVPCPIGKTNARLWDQPHVDGRDASLFLGRCDEWVADRQLALLLQAPPCEGKLWTTASVPRAREVFSQCKPRFQTDLGSSFL
jgi:hypothetical protein